MKKFDKALTKIKSGVESAMYDAISNDERSCSYEYDFGNTTIMIEVEVVGYPMSVIVPDVWVEREDCTHNSPKVIEAVKNVLPDWWTIREQVDAVTSCHHLLGHLQFLEVAREGGLRTLIAERQQLL